MSRIYVDRISPYQSGSVQVDGLSLDTGSLVTTASFNAFTASAATTGSNTFNGNQTFNVGDGVFALRANFNNSFFYSVGSQNTVGVLKNDFSEATTIGLGTGLSTYNTTADVSLTANLNGVTSQGDDRPGIVAFSGSVPQDVIALPKTSWDNNGEIEFKIPVKFTNNTAVVGNFVVSGSGANNQWFTDWPSNLQQKNITTFGGLTTWEGDSYNNNFQRVINFGQFGANLEGIVTSFNDSGDSNYYTSQWIGPSATYWLMLPSGSAQPSTISLIKDSGSPTTTATITSDNVILQSETIQVTGSIDASGAINAGSSVSQQIDYSQLGLNLYKTISNVTASDGALYPTAGQGFFQNGTSQNGYISLYTQPGQYFSTQQHGPEYHNMTLRPSGSAEDSYIRLQHNGDTSTSLLLKGDNIQVTGSVEVTNDFIVNGGAAIAGGVVIGSSDPLPSGEQGASFGLLMTSGSGIYFYDGANWREIAFVS